MYQEQDAHDSTTGPAGPDASEGSPGPAGDDVVDAEFEEVKDKDNN
jgi:hypothetical protein